MNLHPDHLLRLHHQRIREIENRHRYLPRPKARRWLRRR